MPREFIRGLPEEGLVLRVRETAEQKAVGFTTSAKNCGIPGATLRNSDPAEFIA